MEISKTSAFPIRYQWVAGPLHPPSRQSLRCISGHRPSCQYFPQIRAWRRLQLHLRQNHDHKYCNRNSLSGPIHPLRGVHVRQEHNITDIAIHQNTVKIFDGSKAGMGVHYTCCKKLTMHEWMKHAVGACKKSQGNVVHFDTRFIGKCFVGIDLVLDFDG